MLDDIFVPTIDDQLRAVALRIEQLTAWQGIPEAHANRELAVMKAVLETLRQVRVGMVLSPSKGEE